MPDIGFGAPRKAEATRVAQALAELANGGLAERMRLDAGVRVLVTARRALALAGGAVPADADAALVMDVAAGWDPAATTAAEHVEAMPVAELDAFLAAAPRWAARLAAAEPLRRAA